MSALHELIHALRAVNDQLDEARQQLVRGRRCLREAEAALSRLDPDHPETVVPPGFARAGDQIEHTLSTVERVDEVLRDFESRL